MAQFLNTLFSTTRYMPHGNSFLWTPGVLWLNVVSDVIIAAAYYSIPLCLFYVLKHRKDIQFNWMVKLFALFILACGTTHLMDIIVIWHPYYGIQGTVKMITAGVSLVAGVMLWPLMPKILTFPSPARLNQAIQRLRAEVKERIVAEQEARLNERRLRDLIGNINDYGIIMLDPNGCVQLWSEGARRLLGYEEVEVMGQYVAIFYPKESRDQHFPERELGIASSTGRYEEEGWRVRKDGSRFFANVVVTSLRDASGKLIGFTKISRDITEKMRRQEQLESQLHIIANALPVWIAQFDLNEKLLYSNETFKHWLERGRRFNDQPAKEPESDRLSDLTLPSTYAEIKPYLRHVVQGKTVNYERVIRNDQGVDVTFSVSLIPDKDADGRVHGFLVIGTDVTAHKEIERQLREAKEQADAASAAKSAFLANMSHEIRTPLGAVLGFAELMASAELSVSEKINSVEAIKRNGRLLSTIINDILDLSKVEAGRLEMEMVDASLEEIVADADSFLNLEAQEKGLQLHWSMQGPLPSMITTDPLRLRQVILNVVGNAIKFTERGNVYVTIKMLPGEDAGKWRLAFIVKDTGIGISSEQAAKLFQPFTQADASMTRKFGGTGLGLVLSKRLAAGLGGDLELTASAPGQGATFTLTIDPGAGERQLRMYHPKPKPELSSNFQRLDHLKVLVVEDSMDIQVLVKRLLRMNGVQVETASNGKEGVSKALAANFDVVLMDLQMPEMDGFEATRQLRAKGYDKPIIALTAHAMKEERARCLAGGFSDHISKPVDHKKLEETLIRFTS